MSAGPGKTGAAPLTAPRTSGARFNPRALPAEDAAAFVRRSLQSIPTRYEAAVTVSAPAAAVAKNWCWR